MRPFTVSHRHGLGLASAALAVISLAGCGSSGPSSSGQAGPFAFQQGGIPAASLVQQLDSKNSMYVLKTYHLDLTSHASAEDTHTANGVTSKISEDVDEADPNVKKIHATLVDGGGSEDTGAEEIMIGEDRYTKFPGKDTWSTSEGATAFDSVLDIDTLLSAFKGTGRHPIDITSAVYAGTDDAGHRFELYWTDPGSDSGSTDSGTSSAASQLPMKIWTNGDLQIVKVTLSTGSRDETIDVSRPNDSIAIATPSPTSDATS